MKYSIYFFKQNPDCVLVGEGNGRREFILFEQVSEMVNYCEEHFIDVLLERCYPSKEDWKAANKVV